jgi:uncharacterized protein (TIGR03086 family)
MTDVADRYRRLSEGFTARVEAVPGDDPRWANASPCADWNARDVVAHMLDTHQLFFGLVDHEVAPGPTADEDPLRAWAYVRDAMQAALDDPEIAGREHEGMFGRSRWDASVDRFINTDVLIHTWDLARALGVDDRLDADEVKVAFETARGYGDAARNPQTFGPEVPAPPGADEQDRLLAFVGRDPSA